VILQYKTPDASVILQYKLGAKNAGTFDVGCACASFPPLVAIGSGLIATCPSNWGHLPLFGAETHGD
jgi:3-oxoacyl-[acyl-carrier-protein] synthase-3